MNKKLLNCLWVVLGGLVILVICAMIIGRREEPDVETEAEIIVRATIEEETNEEETTAVDTVEPVATAVAPEPTTEPETELPSYSVEEMAWYVLIEGLNGDARKEALSDNYEAVQRWLEENYEPPVREYAAESYDADPVYYGSYGDVLTPAAGINYYAGRMETYYNLPMGGVLDIMQAYGYDYDYWVRGDGVKMYGPYVMVAADLSQYPRGTIVDCSLGTAMVVDTGSGGWDWLDIAVAW